jgi:arylsulfatase A-like enzyme
MTGRYQQRFGHEFNPGPPNAASAEFGLSLKETTLPERLNAAGYATGMVGKWHLGHTEKFNPVNRGFQEYFGFLGGAHSYFDSKADANNPIVRGLTPVDEKEYLTDAFAREAVAFIDRHQKEPFFLYLAFNAVHTPMHASQKYLDRFSGIENERRRTYAAMMSAMDDAIGAVLARLRAGGLEENTLVFFISDNGGPPVNGSSNGPLRGFKAQTLEGGIRVPFLVQWKGKLPAGKTYDQPVIQLDITATALAAADALGGASSPQLDGVNLLPYLSGEAAGAPRKALYWRFGDQMAIRMGDWKLVKHRGESGVELYNLASDMGEQNDLAAKQPEKLKELQDTYAAWDAQLAKPTWGAPARRAARANRTR